VLEGLRGIAAARAGGGAIIVPGRVGAEVALTRPHLVQATHVELGKAHEGVGFQRGAVFISGGVRHNQIPFFHEAVLAQELELGVGVARGGRRVRLAEQVLGGDGEGGEAIGAEEGKHRVREGV